MRLAVDKHEQQARELVNAACALGAELITC